MRQRRLAGVTTATVVLALSFAGCAPNTPQHANSMHPGYGEAEYKNDLAQCRKENSQVVNVSGYEDHSEVRVNEPKAQACMSALGWQDVAGR